MTRTSLSESPPCPRCGRLVAERYVRAQDGRLYHARCFRLAFPPPEYKVYDGRRNKRTVWGIQTEPFAGAHFATFPTKLVEPCVLAGCPEGGTVLDPFCGAGTTGLVAQRLGRDFVGIELNPEYAEIARRRISDDTPLFARAEVTP